MSFRIELRASLPSKIQSWALPDQVLVEVYLRLREELASNPSQYLVRSDQPFDGMTYSFSMIDPGNRFCEHFFAFHVVYEQDKQTLIIANGACLRSVGL